MSMSYHQAQVLDQLANGYASVESITRSPKQYINSMEKHRAKWLKKACERHTFEVKDLNGGWVITYPNNTGSLGAHDILIPNPTEEELAIVTLDKLEGNTKPLQVEWTYNWSPIWEKPPILPTQFCTNTQPWTLLPEADETQE